MRKLLFLLLFIILYSCNEKKSGAVATPITSIKSLEHSSDSVLPPPVYIDSAATEQQVLAHLAQRKKDIQELLKSATPVQANKWYEAYKIEDDSAIYVLMIRDRKQLEEYSSFYETDEKTLETKFVIPKDRKPWVENIKKHELIIEEDGEGGAYFTRKNDYYYNIFNGKLSPDYQRYVEIFKEEEKGPYAMDNGIIVPWKNIGDRILAREKFLKDFPKSPLIKNVKYQLKSYRWDYFLGEDNTPVFPGVEEYADKIDENIYKEYQRFMKANPTSETTQMLKALLKNNTQDAWKDHLNRLLGERYE